MFSRGIEKRSKSQVKVDLLLNLGIKNQIAKVDNKDMI